MNMTAKGHKLQVLEAERQLRLYEDTINRSTPETRAAKDILNNYIYKGRGPFPKKEADAVIQQIQHLEDHLGRSTAETRTAKDIIFAIFTKGECH